MRKDFRADLHVHTVLSPCAEIEMLPPLIVRQAVDQGIQVIAITDHNATANIAAVQKAAEGFDLVVLPGMELQTREEVHVLCLFDTLDQAFELQKVVDDTLLPIRNDPEHFGVQLIVDAQGELVAQEERLLLASVDLTLTSACRIVADLGGLFIPAHVDRKAFGLLGVLGFVPGDLPVRALEISRNVKPAEAATRYPQLRGYALLQNGDAHRLDEIHGRNHFHITAATMAEFGLAIQQQEGRSLNILA